MTHGALCAQVSSLHAGGGKHSRAHPWKSKTPRDASGVSTSSCDNSIRKSSREPTTWISRATADLLEEVSERAGAVQPRAGVRRQEGLSAFGCARPLITRGHVAKMLD
jgi:hypothetical protein